MAVNEDREPTLEAERAQDAAPANTNEPKRKRTRKRGRVTVFANWCKGCGLCVAFCPQKVLASGRDGHTIVVHPEKCVACNWCYEHCPDCAIVVEPYTVEEELPAERPAVEVTP